MNVVIQVFVPRTVKTPQGAIIAHVTRDTVFLEHPHAMVGILVLFSSPEEAQEELLHYSGVSASVDVSVSRMFKFYVKVFYVMGKVLTGYPLPVTGLVSSPVRKYRELLLSPWCGHGHHTFKVLQQRFFHVMGKALSGKLSCTQTDLVL